MNIDRKILKFLADRSQEYIKRVINYSQVTSLECMVDLMLAIQPI